MSLLVSEACDHCGVIAVSSTNMDPMVFCAFGKATIVDLHWGIHVAQHHD